MVESNFICVPFLLSFFLEAMTHICMIKLSASFQAILLSANNSYTYLYRNWCPTAYPHIPTNGTTLQEKQGSFG